MVTNLTKVSECPLTSLAEGSGTLTIKPVCPWGLQPNLCFSPSKMLLKGLAEKSIESVLKGTGTHL